MNLKISLQERIGDLIRRLNNGEYITTESAATYYGISVRNAERDFTERLPKYLTIKILKNKVTKEWYLEKNDITTILTAEDELTINLLLEHSKNIGIDFYRSTYKLIEKFKDSIHSNTIYAKLDIEDISDVKIELMKVEKAIIDKNIIQCLYKNKKRKIKPLKLACFDGYWYLVLKDTKDNLIKKYYFKDIQEIIISSEIFNDTCVSLQKKLDNAINAYFDGNKKEFLITLFVEKEIAHLFKRKKISKSQRIINKYKDGSLELELFITHEMEILPLVKRFEPHIKII